MMNIVAVRACAVRSILGFLMLLGAACESRQLTTSSDAAADVLGCANVGCAAPPMCSAGCQATCGCCSCTPGEHVGDLVCADQGCYQLLATVCMLPFEVGPCDALFRVFAFVDGACVPRTYGGCEGNANRFSTLEECLAACEGRPVPNGCPAGRIAQEICLACGPAGGCSKTATVCALACDVDAGAGACASSLPVCHAGVCQNASCD